ncbi:MAG: translation initiation factor IF-3 [bacterium]
MNHRIKHPQLRVISATGENLGVIDTREALRLAQEQDLDVVVITENAVPPVAKITDFNKFLYAQRKKASEAKGKSKQTELKELRLSTTISEGDMQQRVNRATEFLQEGHLVKVGLMMKGRQAMFPQVAQEKIAKFIELMSPVARVESEPKRTGNTISVTLIRK